MLLDGKEFADVLVDVDNHITPWSTAVSQLWPSPTAAAAAAGPTAAGSACGGSFSQPASCYASTGFIKDQIDSIRRRPDRVRREFYFRSTPTTDLPAVLNSLFSPDILHPPSAGTGQHHFLEEYYFLFYRRRRRQHIRHLPYPSNHIR